MKHPIANKKFADSVAFIENAAQMSKDPLQEGDKAVLLSFIELAFNQVLMRHRLDLTASELFNFNRADNHINLAFKYAPSKYLENVIYYVTLDCIQSNHATFALYGILDALASNNGYSTFEGLKVKDFNFILGDGDDWGAVTINGGTGKAWYDMPKSITFWVRHLG